MLNFMYDSLETVKKLKHPSRSDFINITLLILLFVAVGGIFFVIVDGAVIGMYQTFYTMIAW